MIAQASLYYGMLVLLPLAVPEDGAATVTVTVRAQATVGVRPVTVGDIAEVSGANSALCKTIAELDVAAPLGRVRSIAITRSRVAIRILLAGFPGGLVGVDGAEHVEV